MTQKARTVSTAAPKSRVSMSDLYIDLFTPIQEITHRLTMNRIHEAVSDPEFDAREFRRKMVRIQNAENRAMNAINSLLNT